MNLKQDKDRKTSCPKYCARHKTHFITECVYCDEMQKKLEDFVKRVEAFDRKVNIQSCRRVQ